MGWPRRFCAYRDCYNAPMWKAARWYPYCSKECQEREDAARRDYAAKTQRPA